VFESISLSSLRFYYSLSRFRGANCCLAFCILCFYYRAKVHDICSELLLFSLLIIGWIKVLVFAEFIINHDFVFIVLLHCRKAFIGFRVGILLVNEFKSISLHFLMSKSRLFNQLHIIWIRFDYSLRIQY
jgi:hypothetical protein